MQISRTRITHTHTHCYLITANTFCVCVCVVQVITLSSSQSSSSVTSTVPSVATPLQPLVKVEPGVTGPRPVQKYIVVSLPQNSSLDKSNLSPISTETKIEPPDSHSWTHKHTDHCNLTHLDKTEQGGYWTFGLCVIRRWFFFVFVHVLWILHWSG